MWTLRNDSEPVAKKEYHCQASDWIDNTLGWNPEEYNEEDRRIILQAKSEGCRILKGTQYVKLTGLFDGNFTTFRARKDLHDICIKYDLYDN